MQPLINIAKLPSNMVFTHFPFQQESLRKRPLTRILSMLNRIHLPNAGHLDGLHLMSKSWFSFLSRELPAGALAPLLLKCESSL